MIDSDCYHETKPLPRFYYLGYKTFFSRKQITPCPFLSFFDIMIILYIHCAHIYTTHTHTHTTRTYNASLIQASLVKLPSLQPIGKNSMWLIFTGSFS